MPTPLFEFNSAENFDTAWIFVTNFSTRDGQDNIQVPAYLSTQASTIGTWTLVVGGTVLTTNQDFSSLGYDPEFGIAGGGKYTVGEKQQNRPYRNTIDNSTTETVPVIGEYIGGATGTGFTVPSANIVDSFQHGQNNETAWYVFDQTGPMPWTLIVFAGDIFYFGPYPQHNLFDNPLSQPFGSTTFDCDDVSNHVLPDGSNAYGALIGPQYIGPGDSLTNPTGHAGVTFTRGQKVSSKSTSSTGEFENTFGLQEYIDLGVPQGDVSVFKIAKKSIDTTVTRIIPSTINQDTNYEFYEVIWTTSSEVNNYTASACLVLPVHILQRSISQRSTAMKINGLDLGESYVRVASDMASGLTEVKDLYDNYGIEAQAIPIILTIGGNAISIGINQIADIAINNNQDKHILRYDETTEKWQNILAADVTFTGSYFDLVDAPGVPSIENMDDTEISNTLADGNILKWDDGLQKWVNTALSTAIVPEDSTNLYFSEQRARESFTTTFNKLHMDYDLLSDSNNNVAISSVQSIVMFLDTNNNEDGNYFGLFNNEDETTTALSKESAIFRVEENGDIYSDGNLILDGEIIGRNIGNSTNYATSQGWQAGAAGTFSLQTGYYGGDFINNGSQAENSVIWGPSPFGGRSLLWQTIGGSDLAHNADGGWDKSIGNLPSSQDHAYLSYVYVKRTSSTTGGSFYHGCAICLNSDGTENNNPYFVGPLNIGSLPQDVWCVSIGIILAHADAFDPVSLDIVGLYRLDTGAKILSSSVFRSKSLGPTDDIGHGAVGPEMQVHRTYHYYSTDATSALSFAKPGFHVIDGNEPSFNMLVNIDLNIDTASSGQVLSWDGSNYSWVAQSGGTSGTDDYEIDGGPPVYIINGGSPTDIDTNELDGGTI